ncbi:DUF1906 domain-containing protein [Oscillospiraceae bacterium CM]|nr:DUF1906 domain-containing protein [Oscillospiraceae bacterium CM]
MASIKGIDTSTPILETTAAALYTTGYRFVCRYLVPDSYPKHLSYGEAERLTAAGLSIVSVFETSAKRARGGGKNGSADGLLALEAARAVKMPEDNAIIFAVDFQATAKDMVAIEAYLRAAKEAIAPYKVGVYGSFDVIEEMAQRAVCDCFWQTYAWSGGKKSARADIYQYQNGQTAAGISVDFNEAYNEKGLWRLPFAQDENLPTTVGAARKALTEISKTGAAHSPWADAAVEKLTKAGIISGDGNGNFGWEQCMTREAVATALYNTLEKLGLLDKLS